jgi:rubrerythrin
MSKTNPLVDKSGISRRRFFGYAGAVMGAGLLIGTSGCKEDAYVSVNPSVNLGSGDIGMLNYAYALEQIEAAFYSQAATNPYSGITAKELAYLNEIRDHEIAHREFFRVALGNHAIQDLTPNFLSINFSDRTSVLTAARNFEDLGVSAYNGAGQLLSSPDYLTLAGKIVSVEARHAAIIRELLQPNSFADTSVLDAGSRRDLAREPSEVLAIARQFIRETIDAENLPNA